MTDQQESLQEDDVVEVFNDYRQYLNGLQGTVFAVVGDRIYTYFENAPPGKKRAVILRKNVRKVEGGR